MNHCLACGREFPTIMHGEVQVGGYMLCLGCGHVMVWEQLRDDWTEELYLRELTEAERIDAGSQTELMDMRRKIVPDTSIKHGAVSGWLATAVIALVVVMAVLEKSGVVPPIHQGRAPIWHRGR